MDECDFFPGDSFLRQVVPHILIEPCAFCIKGIIDFRTYIVVCLGLVLSLWSCHVAEDNLRTVYRNLFSGLSVHGLDVLTSSVLLQDVLAAPIQLAPRLIGKRRVNHALGIADLSAVAGDFQHIINGRVNVFHIVRPLFQAFHVLLLEFTRFAFHNLYTAAPHLRDFEARNLRKNV